MNPTRERVSHKVRRMVRPISFRQFQIELNAARSCYDRKKANLEKQLKAFQETCKHEKTSYNQDPAGGSDSFYSCDLCDKVL